MRAPPLRTSSIAAKHASHADAEIAWLIADRCSTRVARSTPSGSDSGCMREAAEPVRRYENSWPFAPCETKYTPVGADSSIATPSVDTRSSIHNASRRRPNASSPTRVTYALRAPRRAAAIAALDVSPPKPCSQACGSGERASLNSIIASPSATTSKRAFIAAMPSAARRQRTKRCCVCGGRGAHVRDIGARFVQIRAGPEPRGALGPPRPHVVGPDAADGEHERRFRQHGAPRAQRRRHHGLGWKELEAVRACGERRECLGGCRYAGQADESDALGLVDDGRIGMRHYDQLSAGIAHARDVDGVEHRSRTDQALLAMTLREAAYRFERPRRVERHLEDAEAFRAQRVGNRVDFVGRDAAQHRDPRQRREIIANAHFIPKASSRAHAGATSITPALRFVPHS